VIKLAFKGLLARKLRTVLTGFAVVLGVAFVASTFIFTDTIDASFKTPEAQKIYADKGYRSIIPAEVDKSTYPDPKKLFKIDKFGGWDKVNAEFFDPEGGSVAKIEQDLGVSTAK